MVTVAGPTEVAAVRPMRYSSGMVAAIRKTVTVGPNGRIEIDAPQLPPGTRAEVIVLLPRPAEPARQDNTARPVDGKSAGVPNSAISALDALQNALNLDKQAADRWAASVRAERLATPRPR